MFEVCSPCVHHLRGGGFQHSRKPLNIIIDRLFGTQRNSTTRVFGQRMGLNPSSSATVTRKFFLARLWNPLLIYFIELDTANTATMSSAGRELNSRRPWMEVVLALHAQVSRHRTPLWLTSALYRKPSMRTLKDVSQPTFSNVAPIR